jgi:hypothetical protein
MACVVSSRLLQAKPSLGEGDATREFIKLASSSALSRRIGVLGGIAADDPEGHSRLAAFSQELQQLGWTEGLNVHIDARWSTVGLNWRRAAVVILHALFDLKPGVIERDFRKALEDFCGHLRDEGYVIDWRWMRQIIPPGPSFPRPTQSQFVAFEFSNEEAEQRCYEYVAANAEPIRSLHRAMNSKVARGSAMFFVCADV